MPGELTNSKPLPNGSPPGVPERARSRLGASGPKAFIFVVDDDPIVLEVTETLLRLDGYRTQAFQDPEEAGRAFASASPRPQVLLSDYVMNRLNGLELIELCVKLDGNLRTILMSGSAGEEILHRGRVKPHQFLLKPFHRGQLLGAVRAVLDPPVEH